MRELRAKVRRLEQENLALAASGRVFCQGRAPKMIYPFVKDMAEGRYGTAVPVSVTCRVLGIARSGYYTFWEQPVSAREYVDAYAINALFDEHQKHPEYGYRLLSDQLRHIAEDARTRVEVMNERRVWRCHQTRITSVIARRKPKHRSPLEPCAEDHVQRAFGAEAPNRQWYTDITEHPTAEGVLYTCAVRDAFSGMIVGLACRHHRKASLVVAAMTDAMIRRDPAPGCVIHSDRGSQFHSQEYRSLLAQRGLVQSMGRVGSSADNAAIEPWFALLQKNVLDRYKVWESRAELRDQIVYWAEVTYNGERKVRSLGKRTPVEYETMHEARHAVA